MGEKAPVKIEEIEVALRANDNLPVFQSDHHDYALDCDETDGDGDNLGLPNAIRSQIKILLNNGEFVLTALLWICTVTSMY